LVGSVRTFVGRFVVVMKEELLLLLRVVVYPLTAEFVDGH
jgi:hypothetical protein